MAGITGTSRQNDAIAAAAEAAALPRLREVSQPAWRELAAAAVEPNGYYLPEWALAVDAGARERSDMQVLQARHSSGRLSALLPVISAWRAFRLPLPLLVAAASYGTLRTPLLAQDDPVGAASALLAEAKRSGAHALVFKDVPLQGAAFTAVRNALARDGLAPTVLRSYLRAYLDATRNADAQLRDALGRKKLKELRRQRHRLAETGALVFGVARTPGEVTQAIETFLALEASGWKGARGTALAQHAGDAAFIRRAAVELAAKGECEIATLSAGATPVASGIILRHNDRAFWFKLGIDEGFARFSPGVQLALDLTQHFCADPEIAFVDSTAPPDSPMINPIWRDRFPMGDVVVPLTAGDPWLALILAALRTHQLADRSARRLLHLVRRAKAALRRPHVS